jgi:predicted DNA-binding protein
VKTQTKIRLLVMSKAEKEKRLDALNERLGITHLNELTEYGQEEMEERDWLKKKLGYAKQ